MRRLNKSKAEVSGTPNTAAEFVTGALAEIVERVQDGEHKRPARKPGSRQELQMATIVEAMLLGYSLSRRK